VSERVTRLFLSCTSTSLAIVLLNPFCVSRKAYDIGMGMIELRQWTSIYKIYVCTEEYFIPIVFGN
jgi:hypothetical protein